MITTVDGSVSDGEMWRAIDATRNRPLRTDAAPLSWATPTEVAERLLASG